MIVIKNVTKHFRQALPRQEHAALRSVSLHVAKGQSFALLGPNGAGKTTLMKILLGLTKPTSGTVRVTGTIGYLPEHIMLYPYLTGLEFLRFVAHLYGLSRAERITRSEKVLKSVGLFEARNKKIKTYSKGMLQRLGLAQAIIHHPTVLFLDEPLDGLDPVGRFEMKQILLHLRKEGVTMFLNSHILSDVEELCDVIGIIRDGTMLYHGNIADALNQKKTLEEFFMYTIRQ